MEDLNVLSGKIIAAAIEVHKYLGPGLLESSYEECMTYELTKGGLFVQRQVPVSIVYKEISLECGYRIDSIVNERIVLEYKSVDALLPIHTAQILTYMKFAKKELGLLINFNVPLLKRGLKRFKL